MLFAFVFLHRTIKQITKTVHADTAYCESLDCDNENEKLLEQDEMSEYFDHSFLNIDHLLFAVELLRPTSLVVNFYSSNYRNTVFSPPDLLS